MEIYTLLHNLENLIFEFKEGLKFDLKVLIPIIKELNQKIANFNQDLQKAISTKSLTVKNSSLLEKFSDNVKTFIKDDRGSVKNPFNTGGSSKKPGQGFVLVEEEAPTLDMIGKVSQRSKEEIKVLSTWQSGDTVSTLFRYEGKRFDFKIAKRSDDAHVAHISFLNNGKSWFKTHKSISTGDEKILSFKHLKNSSEGSSVVLKALQYIQHFAKFEGSTRVIVEIGSQNKQILKSFYENFNYLGRKSLTSFGEQLPLNVHSFEILLHNQIEPLTKAIQTNLIANSPQRKIIACSDGIPPVKKSNKIRIIKEVKDSCV